MKIWQIKLMKWIAVVGSVITTLFFVLLSILSIFGGSESRSIFLYLFLLAVSSASSVFLIFWSERMVSLLLRKDCKMEEFANFVQEAKEMEDEKRKLLDEKSEAGQQIENERKKLLEERIAIQEQIENEKMKLLYEKTQAEQRAANERKRLFDEKSSAEKEMQTLQKRLTELREIVEVMESDERVLLQSVGFYTPHYNYALSDEYRSKLAQVRFEQKAAIKENTAITGSRDWSINGSAAQGRKMVCDMQKLLLRAYNAECDDIIEHVRFSNIELSEKRMEKSAETISNLGVSMGIAITPEYVKLKFDELYLMFEYQRKKEEERERARELRQQQKEEERVAKELQELQQKLEKERMHYENAFARIKEQIEKSGETEELLEKKVELEKHLEKVSEEIKDVDYRQANQRAGYVYVISNIGAFGEDVYKIGMTRRLEPMDRVNELGGASVPFPFDVHALIFTDDAPKLETALHNAFSDKKVNFINQRREFFRVSLDEIKRVVKENYDKTVEFVDYPPAEQYRESLKMH